MVFPGVVRRVMKLLPTVMQAVALVVFIHIVGQVTKLLVITAPGHKYYLSSIITGCPLQIRQRKVQIQ